MQPEVERSASGEDEARRMSLAFVAPMDVARKAGAESIKTLFARSRLQWRPMRAPEPPCRRSSAAA